MKQIKLGDLEGKAYTLHNNENRSGLKNLASRDWVEQVGRLGLGSPLAIFWRDVLLELCMFLLAILCDPVKYEILTVMTF